MQQNDQIRLIHEVMGASHLFCSTVSDLLERSLAESSSQQVALSQVKLMLLIGQPGQQLKVTDVADFLGVTNAAASRAIDRLVQRGLLLRTVSQQDRRAVDLSLTAEGEELLEEFRRIRNRELMRVLGDFPDDKLRQVTELLDELSVRLAELETDPEERCLRCGIHLRSGCVMRDRLGRECVISRQLYGDDGDADEGADVMAEAS